MTGNDLCLQTSRSVVDGDSDVVVHVGIVGGDDDCATEV